MQRDGSVDEYLDGHPEWRDALVKLRRILTGTSLEETIKWGAPCYTLGGKNVVGIAAFQDYVGLWFHQGVFLTDPAGVLVNAQEGKTKALRQWRFPSARAIKVRDVRAYVAEAIANQEADRAIRPERGRTVDVPEELATALRQQPRARQAFAALTPGKQREYSEHIAAAKRPATRQTRLAKILPMIEQGVGLNDKYRK